MCESDGILKEWLLLGAEVSKCSEIRLPPHANPRRKPSKVSQTTFRFLGREKKRTRSFSP